MSTSIGTEAEAEAVLRVVAECYDLDREALLRRTRSGLGAEARQVAAYLLHDLCGWTPTEIGRALRRDYSTICYGRDRIARRVRTDADMARMVAVLRAQVSYALRQQRRAYPCVRRGVDNRRAGVA